MIPEKLNNLTFIKVTNRNNDGRLLAEFKCSCGNITETQLRYYKSSKTKSCGCLKYSGLKTYKKEISNIYSTKRTFSKAYRQLKSNARKRNLLFKISEEDCKILLAKPCYLCGTQYDVPISLDRIDNKKGYILGNVKPCCKICNKMKLNMSLNFFRSHITKLQTVAHNKCDELLKSPEKDNQQPSLGRNVLEGSTTRNREDRKSVV